jgi:hypothetical protein
MLATIIVQNSRILRPHGEERYFVCHIAGTALRGYLVRSRMGCGSRYASSKVIWSLARSGTLKPRGMSALAIDITVELGNESN